MRTITTTVHNPFEHNRQQFSQQLSTAWSAARPWVQPPADWLTAAVTALTTPPDAGPDTGQLERADMAELAGWQAIAQQLRQLRAETLEHARAATTRRAQLTQLQARVRARAIDQLLESPDLEGPLGEALTDWGLPPIDDEYDETDGEHDGDDIA